MSFNQKINYKTSNKKFKKIYVNLTKIILLTTDNSIDNPVLQP